MKNVFHKKLWISGEVQIHVELSTILLVKINLDMNSNKYYVDIKLSKKPMLENSYMYSY